MWICFIYTINVSCVDKFYIYTIKERCKLCGYVLYTQLSKGVSCVDMFYIYN